MDKNFEYYFQEIKNKRINEKFVIVLGSGFHHFISKQKTVLNDWNCLLELLKDDFVSSGNYLLDFEKIIDGYKSPIYKNQKNIIASEKENKLLKEIASKIKNVQDSVLKNKSEMYPTYIFNPNFVSDIICLNFDTIAEEICQRSYKPESIKKGFVKITDTGEEALVHLTTKYTEFNYSENKKIRFWHPHGSILKPTSIILSARKYAQHIGTIERLRKHSKSQPRIQNKKDTWYDVLTHKPVLIIGASISSSEWDLWSAFVNRERNYSKPENKVCGKPIFQMRSTENGKCQIDKVNQEWFNPLFNENIPYDEQWLTLEKLLKQ